LPNVVGCTYAGAAVIYPPSHRIHARVTTGLLRGTEVLTHLKSGYSLDSLWEDYRLSAIGQLSIPVWQQSYGLHPSIWWPHLHRILAAFEYIGCAALLS